jgi:hypothetical protein
MRNALICLVFLVFSGGVIGQELKPQDYSRVLLGPATPPVDVPCSAGTGFSALSQRGTQTYVMVNAAGWGSLQWVRRSATVVDVYILAPIGIHASGSVYVAPGAMEVIVPLTNFTGAVVGSAKICAGPNFGGGEQLMVRATSGGVILIPEWQQNDCPPGTVLTTCVQRFLPLDGN